MPAKSKDQYKFMKAVASGAIKAEVLSKKEAKEFIEGNKGSEAYKRLPKDIDKEGRFKRLKKAMEK